MVIIGGRAASQQDLLLSSAPNAAAAAGSSSVGTALKPQRQALKRRGSLSKFYFSKSQSFNCMADLVQPFLQQSALALAKPLALSPSWQQQPFSCIEEWDEHYGAAGAGGSLHREPSCSRSEPGSPTHGQQAAADLMAGAYAFGGGSSMPAAHIACQHHHARSTPFSQQALPVMDGCGGARASSGSVQASSLSLSSSGSCRTSMDSYGGASGLEAACGEDDGAYCCSQQPTEELCEALQAASLAARHTLPMWHQLA